MTSGNADYGRCYLCHERRPKNQTDVVLHTVPSAGRGGTIEGVKRYVRMCRVGYGCKADPGHTASPSSATTRGFRGFRLPEPTICDINCFKQRGHAGPHQKWAGDECDFCDSGRAVVRTADGRVSCHRCAEAASHLDGLEA